MSDDVVTLLTTKVATVSKSSSSSDQDLTSVSPSVSLFKFNHAESNDRAATIDEQIKNLEDQARHLREKLNLSISSSLNNSFKQLDSYKAIVINHHNEHDAESHNLDMNWLTQQQQQHSNNNFGVSSTPKAGGSLNHYHMGSSVQNNFSNDLKSEDVYFTQVR